VAGNRAACVRNWGRRADHPRRHCRLGPLTSFRRVRANTGRDLHSLAHPSSCFPTSRRRAGIEPRAHAQRVRARLSGHASCPRYANVILVVFEPPGRDRASGTMSVLTASSTVACHAGEGRPDHLWLSAASSGDVRSRGAPSKHCGADPASPQRHLSTCPTIAAGSPAAQVDWEGLLTRQCP